MEDSPSPSRNERDARFGGRRREPGEGFSFAASAIIFDVWLLSGSHRSGRRFWRWNMADLLQDITKEQLRTDVPEFAPGDTVRVNYRIREGNKERIQAFEGVCIKRRGGGIDETFTVRKISSGIGVERVFPLHAPTVEGIQVVRRGRVRRAKLYYLRNLRGKAARIRERRTNR